MYWIYGTAQQWETGRVWWKDTRNNTSWKYPLVEPPCQPINGVFPCRHNQEAPSETPVIEDLIDGVRLIDLSEPPWMRKVLGLTASSTDADVRKNLQRFEATKLAKSSDPDHQRIRELIRKGAYVVLNAAKNLWIGSCNSVLYCVDEK